MAVFNVTIADAAKFASVTIAREDNEYRQFVMDRTASSHAEQYVS